MRRTERSAESSFISTGRFRMGGLAGTAMALVIGFLEQAAAHAPHSTRSETSITDQPADISSATAPDTHHASNDGASPEHGSLEHDGVLPAPMPSTHSDADDGSGSISANAEGFWFDANGPVHIVFSTDADHSSAAEFTAFADGSANSSAADVEVVFTSAASSSFQYNGPSILDTTPGGVHSDQTVAISSELPTPDTHVDSSGQIFSGVQSAASFENNQLPTIAGSTGAPAATANSGSETVLQAWNGDIGSGYTNATTAGTGSGGSGGVLGVPNAGDGQGLVINVVYDASVANAPAGFTQAVANVVAFYESHFSNPVTITIDVGYGEIDGQALEAFALGESEAYMTSVSYAQLQSALANNANAIGDTAAAASLAATSPVNGQYWIPTAEAKALGLISSESVSVDGYAGFTNIPTLSDYSATNTSGTVPNSQYDMFGAIAHEFSEIMGRQMLDGADFAGAPGYTALDLFHYSAPGVADFSGTRPGIFRRTAASPIWGISTPTQRATLAIGRQVLATTRTSHSATWGSEPRHRIRPYSHESARLGFNGAIGSAGDYCCACTGS